MLKGNFSYENEVSAAFLTYTLDSSEELDRFGMGMLRNNQINGVIPVTYTQFDEDRKLRMNVTGTAILSDYLRQTISRSSLLNILWSISRTMIDSEDYLLDLDYFILDFDHIFTNVSSGACKLVYLPVEREQELLDLSNFFRKILFSVKSNTSEDNSHIISIMNYLADGNFDLKGFANLIDQLQKTRTKAINITSQQNIYEQPSVTRVKPEPAKEVKPDLQPKPQPKPQPEVLVTPSREPEVFAAEEEEENEPVFKKLGFNLFKKKEQPQEPEKKGFFGIKSDSSEDNNKSAPGLDFAIRGMEPDPIYMQQPSVPVQPAQEPVKAQQPEVPAMKVEKTPVQKQNAPLYGSKDTKKVFINSETVMLNPALQQEDKTVLNTDMLDQNKINPRLIRKKNREVIPLNSEIFRLGTEKNYVNYYISDNRAISRTHANILTRNGSYYVVDTNSLNHTYVNGKMITSHTETELSDGDMIRLANEEFEFKLY